MSGVAATLSHLAPVWLAVLEDLRRDAYGLDPDHPGTGLDALEAYVRLRDALDDLAAMVDPYLADWAPDPGAKGRHPSSPPPSA